MSDNLTIDLIIPLFNKKNHIKRCIDSALNQKVKFNKIIIINDGSTDQVEKILENYSLKNKDIKIINQVNKGVSNARNTGIKNSNSEYVVFLDADDELNEFYLHEIYRLIRFYKNISVFSTKHKNFFKDEFPKIKYIEKKTSLNFSKNPLFNISFDKSILCASGLCLRKKVIHDKLFPENVKIGEDIYTCQEILLKENLAWSSQKLVNVYKNAESRAQLTHYDVPYYITKYNTLAKLADSFKKKLCLNIFHLLSLFIIINQFKNRKLLNSNSFKQIYESQNTIFKIISIFFKNYLSFIIYQVIIFIKKILNEISFFPVVIYLLITPTAPLIFFIFFIKDLKTEASLILIYGSAISLFIFLLTFQNRMYLSKSFSKFNLNYIVIYRLFSSILIFIVLSFIFHFIIKLQNYNLFIFSLSTILMFWIIEIIILRFEKFLNANLIFNIFLFLFSYYLLLIFLTTSVKNYLILSLLYFFATLIYVSIFFLKNYKKNLLKIYKKIKDHYAAYFFFSNIFLGISNFLFRYLMSHKIDLHILSYYFLIFSIATLPSSLYYAVLGQYSITSRYIRSVYLMFSSLILIFIYFTIYLYFKNEIPNLTNLLIFTFFGSIILLYGHFKRSKSISIITNTKKMLSKDFLFFSLCGLSPFLIYYNLTFINFVMLANGIFAATIFYKFSK